MTTLLRKAIKNPRKIIPNIIMRSGVLKSLEDEKYLPLVYKLRLGRKLNLVNPIRFNEKMQWLKLYNRKPEYTVMVDKYEAKKYVAALIGEEYIIPTLGVWQRFSDINFDELPDQFVLKPTHDSGSLCICRNREEVDWKNAQTKLERSLGRNYYYASREWNYKNVKPRIIAEQYIENDSEEGLHDYKVWCFNGKALYVQYITGRIGTTTYEGFYDREWMLQNFTYHNPRLQKDIPRPKQLEKLLELAERISKDLPFARIDFYILPDDSLKFGEITFFPMGGTEQWHPDETDIALGKFIKLPI